MVQRRKSRQAKNGPRPRRISRFIEPALLYLLLREPVHGYGLMDGLMNLGFREYPVDFSAVYRTLRSLEEGGMVESDWDLQVSAGPPRRVYQVTAPGRAYLADWVDDLRATDKVLHAFLDAYDDEFGDDLRSELAADDSVME